MRLVVAAIGQRQPAWAQAAWDDFCKRFPADTRVELKALKAEPRVGRTPAQCKSAEAHRLLAAVPRGARKVALDERGSRCSTAALSQRLQVWREDAREVVLMIGGPDGLDETLLAGTDETLRLSDLTLPHALARIVLVEALYRAWSLGAGHPYHRE